MVQNIFKRDSLKLGLIFGLLAPLISLVAYYFLRFRVYSFGDYIDALSKNKPLLTGLTIPCLLLNIALFTFYINTHRDQTAKGIFTITLLYAIASIVLKFFG
ncbi:MAG: hypothetical protein V4717_07260 [Bacteroidota bacterium]